MLAFHNPEFARDRVVHAMHWRQGPEPELWADFGEAEAADKGKGAKGKAPPKGKGGGKQQEEESSAGVKERNVQHEKRKLWVNAAPGGTWIACVFELDPLDALTEGKDAEAAPAEAVEATEGEPKEGDAGAAEGAEASTAAFPVGDYATVTIEHDGLWLDLLPHSQEAEANEGKKEADTEEAEANGSMLMQRLTSVARVRARLGTDLLGVQGPASRIVTAILRAPEKAALYDVSIEAPAGGTLSLYALPRLPVPSEPQPQAEAPRTPSVDDLQAAWAASLQALWEKAQAEGADDLELPHDPPLQPGVGDAAAALYAKKQRRQAKAERRRAAEAEGREIDPQDAPSDSEEEEGQAPPEPPSSAKGKRGSVASVMSVAPVEKLYTKRPPAAIIGSVFQFEPLETILRERLNLHVETAKGVLEPSVGGMWRIPLRYRVTYEDEGQGDGGAEGPKVARLWGLFLPWHGQVSPCFRMYLINNDTGDVAALGDLSTGQQVLHYNVNGYTLAVSSRRPLPKDTSIEDGNAPEIAMPGGPWKPACCFFKADAAVAAHEGNHSRRRRWSHTPAVQGDIHSQSLHALVSGSTCAFPSRLSAFPCACRCHRTLTWQ